MTVGFIRRIHSCMIFVSFVAAEAVCFVGTVICQFGIVPALVVSWMDCLFVSANSIYVGEDEEATYSMRTGTLMMTF